MVTFHTPLDVDAFYVRYGIERLRVLARWQDRLDARTHELVLDWLHRYDEPALVLNQQPHALRRSAR